VPWNFILVLSAIIAGVIYSPWAYYFLNDDFIHIPASINGLFFQHGFQRPVHEWLLHVESSLWGENAWGYHLTRLVVHFLNSFLVYRLTEIFFFRFGLFSLSLSRMAASASTSIFLVYAFHSEAMLWILGAGASLGCMFILAAIICFLKRDEGPAMYWYSIFFFILALFTYESSWVLPVIIFLLYYFDPGFKVNRFSQISQPLLFLIIFLANIAFRVFYLGKLVSEYEFPIDGLDVTHLLLNVNRLLARCLLPPMNDTRIFLFCYGLVMFLILWWVRNHWVRTKRIFFVLPALCFFVSLMPFLGLGIDTHDRESERFLYLASVFLCMLFAYGILYIGAGFKVQTGCLILFLGFQIFFLIQNAKDYRIAGNISASLFKSMSNVKDSADQIFIPILPVEYNGVPLFRVGFQEGAAWIAKKDSSILHVGAKLAIRPKNGIIKQVLFSSAKMEFQQKGKEGNILQFRYDSSGLQLTSFP
jgi:hypothetical protein